jgi:hypothetical protein
MKRDIPRNVVILAALFWGSCAGSTEIAESSDNDAQDAVTEIIEKMASKCYFEGVTGTHTKGVFSEDALERARVVCSAIENLTGRTALEFYSDEDIMAALFEVLKNN